MPYVYILRCSDSSLYTGQTDDVEQRLSRHNDGIASRFTARRRPVTLVYTESHATRAAAAARERQLKGWTQRKKEALIARELGLLKLL
jgi:predicted GIY-YIG superfamily endonuclease